MIEDHLQSGNEDHFPSQIITDEFHVVSADHALARDGSSNLAGRSWNSKVDDHLQNRHILSKAGGGPAYSELIWLCDFMNQIATVAYLGLVVWAFTLEIPTGILM